jgi:divalent metal cation (Fe/Co/Zn/Cd) transporter
MVKLEDLQGLADVLNDPVYMSIYLAMVAWSIIWKGFALWKAAQNESKPWFIVMLVANTVGILEILYIFVFSKQKKVKD